MIRVSTLALVLCATLQAATIRGTVVENQTGYPIARATVTADLVGTDGHSKSVRSNLSGIFEIDELQAGTYRISAVRPDFAAVQYGQKRWFSPGMPIALEEGDTASFTIRMPHWGAITGTVVDENGVGLPQHEVAAYTNTRPPRLLERVRSDDRGAYRLFNLRPGSYLVRSLAKVYDDETYLPTFYRDAPTPDQAHAVEVKMDEDTDYTHFRAATGHLFTVSGRLNTAFGIPTVTLTSDTGTETASVDGNGTFTFAPMSPGRYELLEDLPNDRGRGHSAAFQILTVDHDLSNIQIPLGRLPTVQFTVEDTNGRAVDLPGVSLLVRRKDASSEGRVETVPISSKISLLPGRWDVALPPGAGYCVVSFTANDGSSQGHSDGWNEVLLPTGSQGAAKFVVSMSPASVSGIVKNANGDAVAGAPVFIEAFDVDPRKRIEPMRSTAADEKGRYRVDGLAPGVYRLLASFDYQSPESAQLDAANARKVLVEASAHAALDLEEFVIH